MEVILTTAKVQFWYCLSYYVQTVFCSVDVAELETSCSLSLPVVLFVSCLFVVCFNNFLFWIRGQDFWSSSASS